MKKTLLLLPLLLTMLAFSGKAQITVFSEGFEDGDLPAGWTNIDADNDGNTWVHNSTTFVDGHNSDGAFVSFSKLNNAALTPDNWLVTPAIPLAGNSTLTFWRMSGFQTPQEHYGIFVSTTSATDLSSFTQVFEETLPSYHWAEKTVDLSAYAGQTVYIAFRHYNCTNKFALILDDVTITTTSAAPIITATPTALQFFNVQEGFPSSSQMVTVSFSNVTNDITAVADAPFEVSLDNITFSSSVTMSNTDTAVFVRYYPAYENNDTAYLTLSDGSVSTTVLLTGNCIACYITLPYMQNFNDAPQFGLPGCWSRINAYNDFPRATSEYGTGSGDKVLMFNCDPNTYEPVYAVMPLMPMNLSDLQITFSTFREGSYSGTFSVGYVSDITDTGSFVPVWSITGPQIGDNNPHPYMVSFANVESDPNTPYLITFKYQANSNYGSIWYWFVDDITVDEISTCAPPYNLETSAVTSSSATLNWDGNVYSYNLYYKTAADTEWTQVSNVTIGEDGYLLENLLTNTTYTWFVAAICDDGTTSNSMENVSFTTECGDYFTPFLQDFNASSSFPDCWHRYTGLASDVFAGTAFTPITSNYSGWSLNNTHVFGARHASLNIYGTNTKYWLVSPPIDLSTLASPTLTFDLALTKYNTTNPIDNPNAQADDKFMVIVSTDYGATWSATNATVWNNDNTGDHVFNQISATGEEVTIPLTDYAGQTVMIAFYGESTVTGNGDNDLHIDNVMVDNATSCSRPNNLTVTEVTDNSVTLTWMESGTATAWNIEYGPAGFTPGAGNGTVVAATSNPFTVTGLSATPYHFYVQSNCGDAQSLWSGPAAATPGTYNMGITGSDTLTTCSLIIYDNGGADGDYSNNCDFTLVLFPENEGDMMAVSGTYVTENNWDFLRIYDNVGTSGTLLGEYCGSGSVPTLVSSSGPLTIKFTSDVSSQRSGFVLTTSCAACMPPANLAVSNVGSENTDLTWTGTADTYLVEYKADSDTAWITDSTSDTTFSLSNLIPNTSYIVNLYSACDNEGYSPATSISFTTPMNAASLPYSTDFSPESDRNWLFYNGSCTNFWKIGSVNDSTNALFVTNNGSTPGYSLNTFSSVSAEKLFTIGEANEVLISFDVNIGGEDSFDYLKVFFAPSDSTYPATNTNKYYNTALYSNFAFDFSDYLQYTGTLSYPYKFNLTGGNTVHVSATMPNPNAVPTANSTAKLVFLWKNDSSGGSQPGAIISNVSVEGISCPSPTNLTVSNLTTNSADISWNAGGEETDWILEYKETADSIWNTVNVSGATTYSLTGLESGATYQVRVQADCGDDNQSLWTSTLVTILCDAITTFPYTEDFEHSGAMPDCWSQEHVFGLVNWTLENGTQSSGGIANAHSGSYNAFLYADSYSGNITRLVSPVFDLTSLTNPYLTYWYAQKPWGNDQDHLSVYYRTSPNSEWQMLVIYPSAASQWTMDSLALPNPSATYQIAFTGDAASGYGIVLDDITIAAANITTEPCNVPESLSFSETGITQTSAVAAWVLDYSVPSWTLQYKAAEVSSWTEVTTDHPWYSINGLTPNTTYQARVRANCSDGGVSEWTAIVTFSTLPEETMPCEAPTGLTSTNVENHAISIAWDANAEVNSWNIRYRVVNSDWTVQTSSTNSYTITGLEGLTTYVIQVQADCGNDGLSEWSSAITVQTTNVGIENRLANSMILYPNPANDVVNVECTMNNVQLEGIDVIDIYGKVVRNVVETMCTSSLQTRINVSGLADGMYFVRVSTDQGVATKPFVVKR